MSVKIVNGRSEPELGLISQHDLFRIIEDFQDHVTLESDFQRPVKKVYNVLIPISVISDYIKIHSQKKDDFINIQFGVTLPNQRNCGDDFKTEMANQVTVVLNFAREEKNSVVNRLDVNDFIITAGFKTNDKKADGAPCCGKPGGGGS